MKKEKKNQRNEFDLKSNFHGIQMALISGSIGHFKKNHTVRHLFT